MIKNIYILIPLITILFQNSYCQDFERINNIDLKSGYLGFSTWCDYNSDGLLDVLVTGQDFGDRYKNAEIYKNNGDKTFSLTNINNIPRVIYGNAAWGDFDNNGTNDLIYGGTRSGFSEDNITKIYKNINNNSFEEVNHNIPNLGQCYFEWVDINNDNLLDIYYQGITSKKEFDLGIFKNMGDYTFEKVEFNYKKISGPRGNFNKNITKWADFNNDGLDDVIIAMSSKNNYKVIFLKNDGNFQFTEMNTTIPNFNYVNLDIGDINNDNLIDIVISGSKKQTLYSTDMTADIHVYKNNNNFNFSKLYSINNVGVFHNYLEIGDINNDQSLDIIYYGAGESNRDFKIYTNNGNGVFSELNHTIIPSSFGRATLGDIDNDSDLDLLYTGRIYLPFEQEILYIYENKNTVLSLNNQHFKRKHKVFPVPVVDQLNIENQDISALNIQIYNALGKIIYSKGTSERRTVIPFKNFKTGVYFVRLSDELSTEVVKVIK